MIRVPLTDEQKQTLKPIFDAVTDAANKSTDKLNLRCAIHGQAWEKDGGYAEFRLLDPQQARIVSAAILDAIEIDKQKEAQGRLAEIQKDLALLTKERTELKAKLAKPATPGPRTKGKGK